MLDWFSLRAGMWLPFTGGLSKQIVNRGVKWCFQSCPLPYLITKDMCECQVQPQATASQTNTKTPPGHSRSAPRSASKLLMKPIDGKDKWRWVRGKMWTTVGRPIQLERQPESSTTAKLSILATVEKQNRRSTAAKGFFCLWSRKITCNHCFLQLLTVCTAIWL